jgi:transcriptional regulator with XRE-family HTH domain
MDAQKLVGKNIKKHRSAAKISQEELAARIGVDQAYVSRLEAGDMNATITTLQQVASALSIDLKGLVDTKNN